VSTEQEYDAPTDMMDDVETDTPGPGPYPNQIGVGQHHGTTLPPVTTGGPVQQMMAQGEQQSAPSSGPGYPSMSQLLDPALDWDPFGLSASMAFPTQFSFDTSNMR
jgi:hypothetical protein